MTVAAKPFRSDHREQFVAPYVCHDQGTLAFATNIVKGGLLDKKDRQLHILSCTVKPQNVPR